MQKTLTYLHDQSTTMQNINTYMHTQYISHTHTHSRAVYLALGTGPVFRWCPPQTRKCHLWKVDLVTVGQFAWPYEPISSDDDIVLIAQEKKVHGSGTRLPFWFILYFR